MDCNETNEIIRGNRLLEPTKVELFQIAYFLQPLHSRQAYPFP